MAGGGGNGLSLRPEVRLAGEGRGGCGGRGRGRALGRGQRRGRGPRPASSAQSWVAQDPVIAATDIFFKVIKTYAVVKRLGIKLGTPRINYL